MPLVRPSSAASGQQLARIERKLDAVLATLGSPKFRKARWTPS